MKPLTAFFAAFVLVASAPVFTQGVILELNEAALRLFGDGGSDCRMSVAQNHGAPGADVVDVAIAVDVEQVGALRPLREEGFAADRFEGAYRRVHAARGDALRAFEQILDPEIDFVVGVEAG